MIDKKNLRVRFRVFISLSACLVVVMAILVLNSISDSFSEEKTLNQIGALVTARAETMNSYYAGELEYIHAEEILREIEVGALLENDLISLKTWQNTDIDMVDEVDILQVVLLEEEPEYLSASVAVRWNVSGINGSEVFDTTYETVCEKNGKTLKLKQFY